MRKTLFAAISAIALTSSSVFACTTILVGSKASNDGSIIVARNNDEGDACGIKNMYYHTAESLSEKTFYSNKEGCKFQYTYPKFNPEQPNIFSYTAFPMWDTFPEFCKASKNVSYEESGFNSKGVFLTATETIFASDKDLKVDPYIKDGLAEDSITSIVLPLAASAKDGIKLLGQLIEEFGSSEGFGVAIADSNEVWYLENAGGHQWLARRVPADDYFMSANQGRYQDVNLNDGENVLYSPTLFEFAEKNNLEEVTSKDNFNFFDAYVANTDHDKSYNYPRVKRLLMMLSEIKVQNDNGHFPVFVKPKHELTEMDKRINSFNELILKSNPDYLTYPKEMFAPVTPETLSVFDVEHALRDHYYGTSHDLYSKNNPKEPYRPVSVLRTAFSHILVSRGYLPEAIGKVQYIAEGMSALSAYIPFYDGLGSDIPESYANAAGNDIDFNKVFWKYRLLDALVFKNFKKYAPIVQKEIDDFEFGTYVNQKIMELIYLSTYKTNPSFAKELLVKFTDSTLKRQDEMLENLCAEIRKDLQYKDNEPSDKELVEWLIKTEEPLFRCEGA